MTYVTERRFAPTHLRVATPKYSSDSIGTLHAYAATFHTLSSDVGGFRERIAPGCFDRALREGDDCRCLVNHDPNKIVGRTKTGTLRLSSDAKGLRTECDLPDTSYGRDLLASVKRGDISECSFGFTVDADDWGEEYDPDDRGTRIPVRTLRSVRLLDTSFVTYPAYPGTSVAAVDTSAYAVDSLRQHTFEQLFPQGVPAEVRSRVGHDVRALLEFRRDQRRRLTNSVLSI